MSVWVCGRQKALELLFVHRLPKMDLKGPAAAPVVLAVCCVVGSAPARTAAVWLSVWATGTPFTPAQTAVCSPSLPFCTIIFFFFFTFSPYMPDSSLPDFIPCILSLSPPSFAFFLTFLHLQPFFFFFFGSWEGAHQNSCNYQLEFKCNFSCVFIINVRFAGLVSFSYAS